MTNEIKPSVIQSTVDFSTAFNALPGSFMLLQPDIPHYTILAVSDEMLHLIAKERQDVVGKSVFEVYAQNPTTTNTSEVRDFETSLHNAITHKIPTELLALRYDLAGEDGTLEERYWRSFSKPVLNKEGEVLYLIHTMVDITSKVKVPEVEKAFDLFMQTPIAVCIVSGIDYKIELANEGMLQFLGRTPAIVGKPIIEALPEAKIQGLINILDTVRLTKAPYYVSTFPATLLINEVRELRYFDLTFKLYDQGVADTEAIRIFCVAHNVTEQVVARRKAEESEQQVHSFVQSAPFPIGVYIGREMRITFANEAILSVWGKGRDVIGKRYAEILPELENQQIFQQLDNVFTTGIPFHARHQRVDLVVDGRLKIYYFNYSFTPLYDAEGKVYGIMNTAADVTDLNQANQKIEESEKNLRNIILQAPVAMCILQGPAHAVAIANTRMYELWGKGEQEMLHKPIFEGLPEAKQQGLEELLQLVFTTGETFTGIERPVTLPRNGKVETIYINFVYEPFREGDGTISGVIAVATDVTEQVIARQKIQESEQELQIRVKERTVELEQQKLFISSILQASFNGIYAVNAVRNEQGSIIDFRYLFANNTIAQSLRIPSDEIIGKTILELVPENKTNGFFDLFCTVLERGEAVSDEVNFTSEKFSSWFSYTIVPIDKDTLVVTLQDISEQKNTLLQIEQQRNLLEKYVEELRRSNVHLEEFAYAASHDLKEPIRKIHIFSGRLKERLKEKFDKEDLQYFERMENATERMKRLIDDLLTYSHVSQENNLLEEVDLNKKVKLVLEDLELEISEKGAIITVDPLPVIKGNKRQLQQLFQNLIGNALKYSKQNLAPQIHITSKVVRGREVPMTLVGEDQNKQFYLIAVKDNGIGFEQEDAQRIFKMFTRLHGNTEYKGTGVGLSIVQKVVENHKGYIWAESQPGEGAIFNLLLPLI